jgi:hypothetical protein
MFFYLELNMKQKKKSAAVILLACLRLPRKQQQKLIPVVIRWTVQPLFTKVVPLHKEKATIIHRPDDRPLPARDPGRVPIPTFHTQPEILPLNLSPGPRGP